LDSVFGFFPEVIMVPYVIGVDIGGTMIKGGLFDAQGTLCSKFAVPTGQEAEHQGVLHSLLSLIRHLASELAYVPPVGIGIAGVLDPNRTTLLESPNLKRLSGLKLADLTCAELSVPVFLENDANCAALGELWAGSGKKLDNFLLYTIGTGIGGGLILNRKLWIGEQGKAGEFGHMIVNPEGAGCACGKQGCLEAEASGSAIIRRAREAVLAGTIPSLQEYGSQPSATITPEQVYHAAAHGDVVCLQILRSCADYLAIAMSNVNSFLDIHHFIIGGGVAPALQLVFDYLLDHTCDRVFSISKEHITIQMAALGNDAGIYGAGFLALQKTSSNARADT